MTQPYANLELTYEGATARLSLARPEKLNPLDWSTVKELKTAIAEIDGHPEVSFVVLTGQGRSFSAGGDLEGYIRLYAHPDEFQAFLDDFFEMLNSIEASPKIWIAAVNGHCVAGGIELLLACDLAVALDTAKIGDGHLNFGQLPGAGGSQRLVRSVGLLRAKHLMLTGELLTAAEAERIGLVGKVASDLEAGVAELIATMATKSRVGLRGAKHLANLTLSHDLEAGLKAEKAYVHSYATTEFDATEGLVAFKEKRRPAFKE
ncbi:MAG: Short chain enoyl-CoA hydratase [Caulobacter sp.]|nr:Short chain enoyl-CoA hydratase [Caulobacter sp.]